MKKRALQVWGLVTCAAIVLTAGFARGSSAPNEHAPAEGAPAHGAAPKGAEAKGDEALPSPTYRLGRPLNGRFDLTTLRSIDRAAAFRYQFPVIETSFVQQKGGGTNIRINLTAEFGAETGLAEIQKYETQILSEFEAIISRADAKELLRSTGKLRLKEELIAALNRRLATAVARRIYITDFIILSAA